ncbi:hypothetical protein ACEE49_07405 [[Pasteurella] aerogenes]
MKEKKQFFYNGINKIEGVSKFEILINDIQEKTSIIAGKYIFRNLTFGFIDINPTNDYPNVFTNILKFSFKIDIKNKKLDAFKKDLATLVNKELRDIPTIHVKYEYSSKSEDIFFELTNQVAYSSEIRDSKDIIYPMLEFLLQCRTKIAYFMIEHKKNNDEG